MKKLIYSAALLALAFSSNSAFAQLEDEKNVTITMDLQPILKLDMSTSDQVNFVFDNIASYAGGITRYGATVLKISSTVDWDLYPVAMSSDPLGVNMDNNVVYGNNTDANALNTIPMSILELHQFPANSNPGAAIDYSAAFQAPIANAYLPDVNNIGDVGVSSIAPYVEAGVTRMIEGDNTNAAFGVGGSYLTNTVAAAVTTPFIFTMDYRIIPGLPVIFPTSSLATAIFTGGVYAAPGVYTMNVKYVLAENQ